MAVNDFLPGEWFFSGDPAQPGGQLLFERLAKRIERVILVDFFTRGGWLQIRAIDRAAHESCPTRQQVALVGANEHAPDVNPQVAVFTDRSYRMRWDKQKAF